MNTKTTNPVLTSTITCHAWNKDRSMIAVCPNSNMIEIYSTNGDPNDYTKWKLEYSLGDHDHHVSAIDWAPNTNRILSCSQDRNAYVWTFEDNIWKPTLVLLSLTRAATCCKWSPKENKFAVGSGAKVVSVCYFQEEYNWWVSKMIKKNHKSTILNLCWHPTDNTILATASSDFKCRVFNAWIENTDKDSPKGRFGTVLGEYVSKGWVHDVQFSPNGNTLAYLGHDSSVAFVDRLVGKEQNVKSAELPFMAGLFISDNAFVAVGYDFTPVAFCKKDNTWTLIGKVDEGETKKTGSTNVGIRNAFAKFQSHDRLGAQNTDSSSIALNTRHSNTINCILPYKVENGIVSEFSTSALDGRVLVWKSEDIKKKFPAFSY